jgi:5-formyltetrahydrofolate cyclo-ligase
MRSKDQVRQDVWRSMEREGVARFPGAEGRIPNFAGAKGAAERLARHPVWINAQTIKTNPDSPQTHARRLALSQGKTLVMAVIKGALKHGKVIDLDQVPELDLVLTGSVAVNLKGARLGKGGGFSDLEYGLLSEAGRIDRRTLVATTVHAMQILRENLLMTGPDIPVNLIATSRAVIEVDGAYRRPAGVLWDHLQPPQIHEIPVLERFGYAG